jgi:hypothetical protein
LNWLLPLLQVARQWEEEGYVDPASFAELVEDEEQLKQVTALVTASVDACNP